MSQTLQDKIRWLLGISVVALILVSLTGGVVVYGLMGEVGNEAVRGTQETIALNRDMDDAQIAFRMQIQEWKDLLLRGRDPQLFQKHYRAFYAMHVEVQASLKRLAGQMTQRGFSTKQVTQIQQAHLALLSRYEAALNQFPPASKPDNYRRTDELVRGIDRKLAADLAMLDDAIQQQVLEQAGTVNDKVQGQHLWQMSFVLAIMLALFPLVSLASFGAIGRMVRRIQEEKERLYVTLNSIGDAVLVTDQAGAVEYLNPVAEAMTGWALDEARGRPLPEIFNIINEDTRKAAMNPVEIVLREGHVVGLANHTVLVARNGGECAIDDSAAPVRDMDGKLCGVVMVFHDVTKQRQAKRLLNESEEQLRMMLKCAPDAVFICGQDGRIAYANDNMLSTLGYGSDELANMTFIDLVPADWHKLYMQEAKLISADNEHHIFEIRLVKKDGGEIPIELNTVQLPDGRVYGSYRDITERKQHEEQLQNTTFELIKANTQIEEERVHLAERVMERTAQLLYANLAKDSFLATMSHEIRTPLGGMLGMMELLGLSRLDSKQREMLQAARDSGESLLRIVNDILDWSKIEAGKLELSPQAASIPEMLKGVVSTYSPLASAKGLLLRQQVDDKIGAAHIFDSLRLSQILNNFTSNAIKFTEQGTVDISAELIARYGGSEEVRFCVTDSGIGMTPEQRAHLFQQYEQASADTARMYGGTGLGLAICRSLAELMGGAISMESSPGFGSTFCFTVSLPIASPAAQRDLQLRQAREDSSGDTPDITPQVKDDGRQVSVLVVDDHPMNRKLLKQQLELLGTRTEGTAHGIVALALWCTGRFDLIITDCHMPEMDGYELTRSIREMEQQEGRQRVPVIAWTANVLAEEEERCCTAGMDDILTKPTDLADLRAMLLKWLAKSGVNFSKAPLPGTPQEMTSTEAAQNQAVTDTPIDFGVLKKIANRPAAQVGMLQEFNLHNRSDIANLKDALKEDDRAGVARIAHRIKGASRMVGALKLDRICTAIEKAAMQGDMDGARKAADTSLDAAIERTETAISKFINGQ